MQTAVDDYDDDDDDDDDDACAIDSLSAPPKLASLAFAGASRRCGRTRLVKLARSDPRMGPWGR